ncbi:IS110 family transposase (plasmid) [Candidatus Arsenophonus nilaparvatae]|uniref:IS110 family transposase n=1 Tax=Candidatus Arsenophonus nilaparvatae TaxID=1247023 RepID=UPI000509F25C|nr:IS110 family transposase [Candidatus Arsenophonus nilaparvatae]
MYQIGIDVSKKKLDICLLAKGIEGKQKNKVIKNDQHSANTLIEWLKTQKCLLEDVRITLESTGTYHEQLCTELYDMGIHVSIVNPYRIREFAKGMGILTKTDRVDAFVLACYGELKKPSAWIAPSLEIRALKSLIKRREALLADLLREQNRQEKTLTTPTPKVVRQSLVKCIKVLEKELLAIESEISKHINNHPELKKDMELLTSIKSIGTQVGSHMLMVLRGHDFNSAEQAAAYLGLVPVERRSGTSVNGRAHLSKIGPSEIRAKLYLSALTAIRHNRHIKSLYDRLLTRGKSKMSALGAAMRKLVHLCYGVLKTGLAYDQNYSSPTLNS